MSNTDAALLDVSEEFEQHRCEPANANAHAGTLAGHDYKSGQIKSSRHWHQIGIDRFAAVKDAQLCVLNFVHLNFLSLATRRALSPTVAALRQDGRHAGETRRVLRRGRASGGTTSRFHGGQGVNSLTRFVIIAALLTSLPAGAEVDGHQLLRFQQEADAFNAEHPEANLYRAGFFGGYLSGMLDALEGRSVCFKVCRCELDAKVADYLRDHPAELDRPVATWLVKLLEDSYPCLR